MHAERLRRLLLKKKIATMPELKAALGTAVDLTVFRKLRELAYRSSYSHRGKYYTVDELEHVLHVGVKDALRKLAQEGRIFREQVSGRLVHLATDPAVRQAQLRVRQVWDAQPRALSLGVGVRTVPDELKAAIILFFSVLDEQQRRLYAGLESLTLGHGGDRKIADLLGLDPGTVAKGRQQLLSRDVEMERVRKTGGGRRPLEKKHRRSSRGSRS